MVLLHHNLAHVSLMGGESMETQMAPHKATGKEGNVDGLCFLVVRIFQTEGTRLVGYGGQRNRVESIKHVQS